jgi:MFS family permease
LRWAGIINSAWVIGTTALGLTIAALIALVFLIIAGWHHAFGLANLIVLVLFGAWLSTRPLWIAPLRRALKVRATKQLAPYMATLNVGADGVDIDLRPPIIGPAPRRNFRFSVGFAELDEVRMMDGLTAQGYMASMAQYDPSFSVRMELELIRFVADQKFRPSLLPCWGIGTQLLLRSSTLFYMVGNADQFGPAAVAAFQAWRTAHPALPTATA